MAGIFDGVKILELGSGAATPLASRYFTEQGARVVRIESRRRLDFLRALSLGPHNPHGPDGAPMFILLNPDKQSVAINLGRPEGIALVQKLVRWADLVTENFSPGVMQKWGLDYDSLKQIKPELILVSGSLFGQTGPQRSYPGFGGQSSAIAGFNHLTGWPDREAIGPFGTISDSLSARYVALVMATALLERRRTGQGQHIDLSQIEACVYSLSEIVVRASATGEVVSRCGNRDQVATPHGIYPCRGEDRWIAIAVFSDQEWRALGRSMGDPEWAQDPRFASAAGRKQHEDDIDAQLARWTGTQEARPLMEQLQRAGVEAGVVQRESDLLADPQLAHRAHFRMLKHARLGRLAFELSGIVLAEAPRQLAAPGPDLGAHTASVLKEILGMTTEEIDRLVEAEVLV